MSANDQIKQRVRDWFVRVIAGGENELAPSLIHDDFDNHEALEERRHGPAGAVATGAWLRECFGEIGFEFHEIVVEGNLAVAYLTMTGTHEGGIPPGVPPPTSPSRSSTCT